MSDDVDSNAYSCARCGKECGMMGHNCCPPTSAVAARGSEAGPVEAAGRRGQGKNANPSASMSDDKREAQHSLEPWRIDQNHDVWDAKGSAVYRDNGWGEPPTFDDCRQLPRIVACVNACAGISTSALERGDLADALDMLADGLEACSEFNPECYECKATALLRSLGRMP